MSGIILAPPVTSDFWITYQVRCFTKLVIYYAMDLVHCSDWGLLSASMIPGSSGSVTFMALKIAVSTGVRVLWSIAWYSNIPWIYPHESILNVPSIAESRTNLETVACWSDTHWLAGTLDWGLYFVRSLRLRQGWPDAVSLSLSTLLSPSRTEPRRQEGEREESPSGANGRSPYGADSSATSGLNEISPSGAPYEAEGSDCIGLSLVFE